MINPTTVETRKWIFERQQNALKIAPTTHPDDRIGWLEDAAYFEAAVNLIDRLEDTEAKLANAVQLHIEAAQLATKLQVRVNILEAEK